MTTGAAATAQESLTFPFICKLLRLLGFGGVRLTRAAILQRCFCNVNL